MSTFCQPNSIKTFNLEIKNELSRLLQRTKAFRLDEEVREQFSFACVVQDRLADAIEYLDSHLIPPTNVNEFYLFMMYADNVFTAVTEFFKLPIINKNVTYPFKTTRADDEESFFKPTFKKVFPNVPDTGIPCDDKFFKYIRALSFAHPYETSAQPFINQKGGEKHYSPGITVKNSPSFPIGEDGDVVITVYTNGKGYNTSVKTFFLPISISLIKDFLISRYNTLAGIMEFLNKHLKDKEEELLQRKVDRDKPLEELSAQILDIYKERQEKTSDLEDFFHLLQTEITSGYPKNQRSVKQYKDVLESEIPNICDAVDTGDYNKVATIIRHLLFANIQRLSKCANDKDMMLTYQYGNIIKYCNQESNEQWRRLIKRDLPYVMEGFAQKWVSIDCDSMPKDEVLLLLRTARFLESKKRMKRERIKRLLIGGVLSLMRCTHNMRKWFLVKLSRSTNPQKK